MKTASEIFFLSVIIFTTIFVNYNNFPSQYGHIFTKINLFISISIVQYIINIYYNSKRKEKINLEKALIDSIITGLSGVIGYSLYTDILLININIHYKMYKYMRSSVTNSAIQTLITIFFISFIKLIKNGYNGLQLITFKKNGESSCNKKEEIIN